MISRTSRVNVVALPAVLLGNALFAAGPAEKPNIVFILADDLGFGDISCYGQRQYETPNIDRLARQGMLFTDHYSGCAVSAPSRCVLMSGLHSGHSDIRGNGRNPATPEGQLPISEEAETIAEVLKREGYVTGAFGKWGLGFITTEGDPQLQGFDEFWGYNCQTVAHRYYPEYLWHNHEKVHLEGNDWTNRQTYSADFIHQKALEFLDENRDKPFFLYYPTTIPHAEITVPEDDVLEKMKGRFTEENPFHGKEGDEGNQYGEGMMIKSYCYQEHPHATFAAMILRLDRYVGELMAKLEEYGIADNTIVFFTSDNGPHAEGGADPEFFDGNGPFRGKKGELHDGGIHIPMIVRWNGHISPGTVTHHPSAFYDIKPTIADMVGGKVTVPADGISFLPVLTGRRQKTHKYLYWEFHQNSKDGCIGSQAVRTGRWKGVRKGIVDSPDVEIELYDISVDIAEDHNVAALHPGIVRKIRKYMDKSHICEPDFPFNYEKHK